jgi:hypothetical protein
MTVPSIVRIGGVLVTLLALGAAAQTPLETRVSQAFDRLETDFLERLNVSESLSPGREDLAVLVRKDSGLSRAWQLEPSLAAAMTTDEIFRFVVSRANAFLVCRVAQLARKDLEAPRSAERAAPAASATGPQDQDAAGAVVAQRLWKDGLAEGPLRLSPGCHVLLDRDDQPASLMTKEEVALSGRLMDRSLHPTSRKQLFEAVLEPRFQQNAEARLRANLDYLRREYGGPPERQPEIEAILERKLTQVFSRQVLFFEAFIASTGNVDRLILLVPLSE